MQRASIGVTGFPQIKSVAKIDRFLARIIDLDRPFAVVDPQGRIIGEVTPRAMMDLLSVKGRAAP